MQGGRREHVSLQLWELENKATQEPEIDSISVSTKNLRGVQILVSSEVRDQVFWKRQQKAPAE